MAQCVAFDAGGVLVASSADPCTTLVVLTPAEYGAMSLAPFQLDTQAAGEIALAILGVWAVAWAFRMLIRTVNVDSVRSSTSSLDD